MESKTRQQWIAYCASDFLLYNSVSVLIEEEWMLLDILAHYSWISKIKMFCLRWNIYHIMWGHDVFTISILVYNSVNCWSSTWTGASCWKSTRKSQSVQEASTPSPSCQRAQIKTASKTSCLTTATEWSWFPLKRTTQDTSTHHTLE